MSPALHNPAWPALTWVSLDCFLSWTPAFVSADKALVAAVVALPLIMTGCWGMCVLWVGNPQWKAVIPLAGLCLGLTLGSLLYIDWQTLTVQGRPNELLRLVMIITAFSFLPALAATDKHFATARRLLLFGFAIGMLGAFQDFICGPQPRFLQGSVCGGVMFEQYVRYVLTALVVAVLGVAAINQAADWLRDKFS